MNRGGVLTIDEVIHASGYSYSQFHLWLKEGACERKKRERKVVCEQTIEVAIDVIKSYPHFSGVKGQMYMVYHRLGFIPQHFYKELKRMVRRLVFQEVSIHNLLPPRTSYSHERAEKPGEIWAEDFTQITVYGHRYYIALVMDVMSQYYLGACSSTRAGKEFVALPLDQAVTENQGKGPTKFLLSDNGKQYIDQVHKSHLEMLDIIHKKIPACTPQYNGTVECGVKEFKNVFYPLFARMEENKDADKKEKLDIQVAKVVEQCRILLNDSIPRVSLNGVTPKDVHNGEAYKKILENQLWSNEEKKRNRKEGIVKTKSLWNVVKKRLFSKPLSKLQLMTIFCFFLKRPLRKVTNLISEVLGNFRKISSDFS